MKITAFDNLVIQKSDEGKSVVIINKVDYFRRMEGLIKNS